MEIIMSLNWCCYEVENLEWYPSVLTKFWVEKGEATCFDALVPIRVIRGAVYKCYSSLAFRPLVHSALCKHCALRYLRGTDLETGESPFSLPPHFYFPSAFSLKKGHMAYFSLTTCIVIV